MLDLLKYQKNGLKVLNALNFLMPSAFHPPTAMASDLAAFHTMVDLPLCGHTIPFPVMDCRWGLATTDGAFHYWHIDCDGFGTYIDTQAGSKWWVLASPEGPFDFSDTSFLTEKFQLDSNNGEVCRLEAVLLTPGSRL